MTFIRLLVGFALLSISSSILVADDKSSSIGNVVIPQPTKPLQAESCVEPTEIMRRDHMTFLLHQRDETVIEGIRSKKYSLTGCIDCHAQAPDNGEIVRIDNPDHFCTGCHQYTAVKIDCFECHADRPLASFTQSVLDQKSDLYLANSHLNRFPSPNLKTLQNRSLNQENSRDN